LKVLITGGAGFIGSNAAQRYGLRGDKVVVLDDLSRAGSTLNMEWLRTQGDIQLARVDIRNAEQVRETLEGHRDVGLILHLAGQVAVTSSISDPRHDFEVNALGTFNVLETVRLIGIGAPLIYASTNKVYGEMADVAVVERDDRYVCPAMPEGVSEARSLDFQSPYGCSKGAADQYVLDYHRIYGLRTVVFRQSCIYGPRQFGIEEQGWVAWFTIAATRGWPITVYGDGKQVRDILFVGDLLDAFDAAARIERAAGRAYNVGGGRENAVSIQEVLKYLEGRRGRPTSWRYSEWRASDQKVYVSDISRARAELNWAPRVNWQRGMDRLYDWVVGNEELFQNGKSIR
jgi:CDP-paratose 2-epimerase